MNNNYYEIPETWYRQFNNTFNPLDNIPNNFNMNPTSKEVNPSLGNLDNALSRGNLFNNLYLPYKNYKYRPLSPSNKQEELLYQLMKYSFAMKELDLYLDIYPSDSNMINLYNQYLKESKNIKNEYEKNYGPLSLSSNYLESPTWLWVKNRWPWEGTK